MELNELRAPSAKLLIDGKEVAGFVGFESISNSYYQADTFTASIALWAQPKGKGIDYWAGVDKARVEIRAGDGDLETVFVGEADGVMIDPITGRIELDGRDLSGEMVDTRATDKFLNLRTHRVAERIGKKRGLKVVAPQSKTIVGTLFGDDTTEITARYSEWELMTFLAQREGRELYVEGDTLYYIPKRESGRPALEIVMPRPGEPSLFTQFRFERNLILARDITVRVVSYDYLTGDTVKKTAKAKHKGPSGKKSTARGQRSTYIRTYPNLSPEQAAARAQAELEDLSKHEVRVFFGGPAGRGLHPQDKIRVSGSSSAFDQDYYVDEIIRTLSIDEGYTWAVRAKNSMPTNQVVE